jgi:hypothetical protein
MPEEYRRSVTPAGSLAGIGAAPTVATGTTAYAGNSVTFAALQAGLEILVENEEAELQFRLADLTTWTTGDIPLTLGWTYKDISHTGFRVRNRAGGAPVSTITLVSYTN